MTDLLNACPGLARWCEAHNLWRSVWDPADQLDLLYAGDRTVHLRAGTHGIVMRTSLAPLPRQHAVLSTTLRNALLGAGELLGQTRGALAIDPARQHLWWQDLFDFDAREHEVDDAIVQFADAARTVGASIGASSPRSTSAPPRVSRGTR